MRRKASMGLQWVALLVAAGLVACGAEESGREEDLSSEKQETVETDRPAEALGDEEVDVLSNPDSPAMKETAPDSFRVRFETSKGDFVVVVNREWSPHGADRFFNLVRKGFYDETRFFRVLEGFMAQFGINGNPEVAAAWRSATIPDDSVVHSNVRGTLSFATGGPNTRTTQLFINYADNSRLDGMGFSPFGEVIEGMDVVDALYAGYGEGAPSGQGPNQARMQSEGNDYLEQEFPELDVIHRAYVTTGT